MKLALPSCVYYRSINYQFNKSYNDELTITNIILEDRDIELIKKAVQEPLNQDNIINVHLQLKELINNNEEIRNSRLTIYTDGSLMINKRAENTLMGFEWTSLTIPRISFNGKVERWPSSTRAKLTTIWSLVLACSSNTKLKIKTDSQAAIDGIIAARNITSNRKWFGINNRSLINEIIIIIKIKSLDIDTIKIKVQREMRLQMN